MKIDTKQKDDSEQGRIQGALYSVQALASASGPIFLRWIYGLTKGGRFLGPGSMFIVASWFYLVAVYCSYLLPVSPLSFRRFCHIMAVGQSGPRCVGFFSTACKRKAFLS